MAQPTNTCSALQAPLLLCVLAVALASPAASQPVSPICSALLPELHCEALLNTAPGARTECVPSAYRAQASTANPGPVTCLPAQDFMHNPLSTATQFLSGLLGGGTLPNVPTIPGIPLAGALPLPISPSC